MLQTVIAGVTFAAAVVAYVWICLDCIIWPQQQLRHEERARAKRNDNQG